MRAVVASSIQTEPRMPAGGARCDAARRATAAKAPARKAPDGGSRCSRAAIQPPCFCAKACASRYAAARRHGQHHFARRRLNAQRVAPRLAVTLHANRIGGAVKMNGDETRLGGAAIKQRAQRHWQAISYARQCRLSRRQRRFASTINTIVTLAADDPFRLGFCLARGLIHGVAEDRSQRCAARFQSLKREPLKTP